MTKGEDEAITWIGKGIGKISVQTRKDACSTFFNTSSNNGRLSFLNNTVGVFEYFAEGDGTVRNYGNGNRHRIPASVYLLIF